VKMVEPAKRASAVNRTSGVVQIRKTETVRFCEKAAYRCGLSPAPRARSIVLHLIPGLAPRALCCRALRALFCDDVYVGQLCDCSPKGRGEVLPTALCFPHPTPDTLSARSADVSSAPFCTLFRPRLQRALAGPNGCDPSLSCRL
jgi:hypothetical protein